MLTASMPLLPMLLAGAAAAVWFAPVGPGALRLDALAPRRDGAFVPHLVLPGSIGAVGWLSAGLGAGLLAAVAVVLVRRGISRREDALRSDRERGRALHALSLLAADLRNGRTPAGALAGAADVAVGASSATLRAAAAAAQHGGDVVAVLRADVSVVASALHALAACWQVCTDAGSGLAAAVERLEEGLRAAQAQRHAVAAELAGPRATAHLLAVLPLAGIGLAAALGADPLHMLLHTPVGLGCLLGGLAMNAAGVLWTRRLVDAAMQ